MHAEWTIADTCMCTSSVHDTIAVSGTCLLLLLILLCPLAVSDRDNV